MKLQSSDFQNDRHGWASLLARRTPRSPPSGRSTAKCVVIGAGITGLACARQLAKRDPSSEILILEARELAQNASGRNSGYAVTTSDYSGRYNPANHEDYQRINRINQAGISILRDQVVVNAIDCDWSETGFYRVAADRHALGTLGEFESYLKDQVIDYRPLNSQDISSELGTDHYQAGFKINGGALLQPAALIYGLADTLPPNVTLYEQTPVLVIQQGSSLMLDYPGGQIETDRLVIAANFEAPKLGQYRGRILGSTLSSSCTRILTDDEFAGMGSEPSWGVLSLHTGGATARLTADRRILIRNTAEYCGGHMLKSAQLIQRQKVHRSAFLARFPHLAHVPFETSWSCVEGISWNGTNFFGRNNGNVYYAGGYNGSGLSRGTAFGVALADWATGEQSQLIDDCLNCPKARRLPPRPLLDIGAWFTVRNRFRGVGKDR